MDVESLNIQHNSGYGVETVLADDIIHVNGLHCNYFIINDYLEQKPCRPLKPSCSSFECLAHLQWSITSISRLTKIQLLSLSYQLNPGNNRSADINQSNYFKKGCSIISGLPLLLDASDRTSINQFSSVYCEPRFQQTSDSNLRTIHMLLDQNKS